jgi:hypothetical protein
MMHLAGFLLLVQLQQGGGLSYRVPSGWDQALDAARGVVVLRPRGLARSGECLIMIGQPQAFSGTAEQFHEVVVRHTSQAAPVVDISPTATLGGFLVTRVHQRMAHSEMFTTLFTARWSDRGQMIAFSASAADLEQRYRNVAEAMIREIAITQSSVAPAPGDQPSVAPQSAGQPLPSAPKANGAARPGSSPAVGSLAEYVYVVPNGWTTSHAPTGIVLTSPKSQFGEVCYIAMSPIAPSSGDLFTDANRVWQQNFSAFGNPVMSTTLLNRGISPQGWEYAVVRRGIAARGSIDPSPEGFAMVVAAKLGDRVATVSWFSKGTLTSSCFVDHHATDFPEVWPRFFDALQFRSYGSPAGDALAKGLAGFWESIGTSVGGGAVNQYVFTPVGRYAWSGVGQRYMGLSRFETAIWTNMAFGDGSYTLRGNTLTLKSNGGESEVWLIRLEQFSEDAGKSWSDKLYMMRPMSTCYLDGCRNKDSELALSRRNQ